MSLALEVLTEILMSLCFLYFQQSREASAVELEADNTSGNSAGV